LKGKGQTSRKKGTTFFFLERTRSFWEKRSR